MVKVKAALGVILLLAFSNQCYGQNPIINSGENFDCVAPCPTLKTKTLKSSPGPRSRTTIGVGEEVLIKVRKNKNNKCGAPNFTIIAGGAGGTLTMITPNEYLFMAGINAGITTIQVTFPAGNNCEDNCGLNILLDVDFNIIAPNGVSFENSEFELGGNPCGLFMHAYNRVSSGFGAKVYILPANVNFYNIATREELAAPVTVGPYPAAMIAAGGVIPTHPANPFFPNTENVSGLGTLTSKIDLIWFGGLCVPLGNPPPTAPANLDGSIIYNIPWEYALTANLAVFQQFAIITQEHVNDGGTLTLTSSKGGASSSHVVNAPTTTCAFSPPCN